MDRQDNDVNVFLTLEEGVIVVELSGSVQVLPNLICTKSRFRESFY